MIRPYACPVVAAVKDVQIRLAVDELIYPARSMNAFVIEREPGTAVAIDVSGPVPTARSLVDVTPKSSPCLQLHRGVVIIRNLTNRWMLLAPERKAALTAKPNA
jgi:hypothetical protein